MSRSFKLVLACLLVVAAGATLYAWFAYNPASSASIPAAADLSSPTAKLDAEHRTLIQQQSKSRPVEPVAILAGHSDGVYSVDFSPDGKLLASGGGEGLIHIWDIASRQLIDTLEGHTGAVMCVRFSPDGQRLLSAGRDSLTLWSLKPRAIIARNSRETFSHMAEFLPDKTRILASNFRALIIWNPQDDTQETFPLGSPTMTTLTVAPTGQVLVGAYDGQLTLWDSVSKKTLARHQRPDAIIEGTPNDRRNYILAARFLGDTEALIADRNAVWRWNRKTDEFKPLMRRTFRDLMLLQGGRDIVTTDGTGLGFFSADGLWNSRCYYWNNNNGHQLALAPDGQLVAVAHGGRYDSAGIWTSDGPQQIELFSAARGLEHLDLHRRIHDVQSRQAAARGIPFVPPTPESPPEGAHIIYTGTLAPWQ